MDGKLPVRKILLGSILIVWVRRRKYFGALAVPTLLFAVAWAISAILTKAHVEYVGWVVLPLYAIVFSLFAVTCHRFILVNEGRQALRRVAIGQRELRFFGWMVGVYIIVVVLKLMMMGIAINAHNVNDEFGKDSPYWLEQLASIPAYYVLGRLSLVFPATAIDRRVNLKWSWRKTSGNGWRMFVVVGMFPWLIGAAIWLAWREGATVFEQGMLTLLSYIGLSIEIFALSFSYREFERHAA